MAETFEIDVQVLHTTARAIQVTTDGDGEGVWLALSLITVVRGEAVPGKVITIELPVWKAAQEGMV